MSCWFSGFRTTMPRFSATFARFTSSLAAACEGGAGEHRALRLGRGGSSDISASSFWMRLELELGLDMV